MWKSRCLLLGCGERVDPWGCDSISALIHLSLSIEILQSYRIKVPPVTFHNWLCTHLLLIQRGTDPDDMLSMLSLRAWKTILSTDSLNSVNRPWHNVKMSQPKNAGHTRKERKRGLYLYIKDLSLGLITKLDGHKESPHTLGILSNFGNTHFAFPIDPIHKSDWHFAHRVIELSCTHNHFHLEDISFGQSSIDQLIENFLLIQP